MVLDQTTSKVTGTQFGLTTSSDLPRIVVPLGWQIRLRLTSAIVTCVLLVGATMLAYGEDTTSHPRLSEAPMSKDAIFLIASMTKPVTSVAAMQLVEAGKINLDDLVSKYLSGFDNLRVITKFNETDATYETRPAKRSMTIRHLLTHTSGIGYWFSDAIVKRLTEATKKDEWQVPLLSDPGDQWNYGASTTVLGMIVEKVSGESLETFFQEHIFSPLGMTDTSYAVPLEKQSRVAAVHRRVDARLDELVRHHPIPPTPTAPFFGDGGLYSTAEDYGTFVRMFLNGGKLGSKRILREANVKLMEENNIRSVTVELQSGADPSLSKSFPLGAGHDKFGLGFQIASGEARYTNYRSKGSLSWAGIYNTEFWVDPVKHIGCVMVMQVLPFYDDGAIRTLRAFEQSVYKAIEPAQISPTAGSKSDDATAETNDLTRL